jgi:hypothetical protein
MGGDRSLSLYLESIMPLPLSRTCLADTFSDLSTAATLYFCAPYDGYLDSVQVTLNNAITTADNAITVEVDDVAKGTALTVAFTGSAAGSTFRQEYQNVPVKRGSKIDIINSGASDTTCIAPITVTFRP